MSPLIAHCALILLNSSLTTTSHVFICSLSVFHFQNRHSLKARARSAVFTAVSPEPRRVPGMFCVLTTYLLNE